MTKIFFLAFTLLTSGVILQAQTPQALKKIMELKMPKTAEDDNCGTRGATVAWHPVQKKLYAVFAGNTEYPMAVFDIKGKRLSSEDLTTMADTRGLWYDPTTKSLFGNGYSDVGWFAYELDKSGIPTDVEEKQEGMNQPGVQSVGAYNTVSKQVLFLNLSQVYMYNSDAELVDSIIIHWGRKKTDGADEDEDVVRQHEDYNSSTVVYTGIKGQELGLLNITNKQIELYDIKTGFITKVLTLPETSVVEPFFNFAYANGTYWLFNIEMRKWVGYK